MSHSPRKKIIFGIVMLCYLAALACGLTAGLMHVKVANDAHRAALIAATLYFLGCGAMLQLAVRVVRGSSDDA